MAITYLANSFLGGAFPIDAEIPCGSTIVLSMGDSTQGWGESRRFACKALPGNEVTGLAATESAPELCCPTVCADKLWKAPDFTRPQSWSTMGWVGNSAGSLDFCTTADNAVCWNRALNTSACHGNCCTVCRRDQYPCLSSLAV